MSRLRDLQAGLNFALYHLVAIQKKCHTCQNVEKCKEHHTISHLRADWSAQCKCLARLWRTSRLRDLQALQVRSSLSTVGWCRMKPWLASLLENVLKWPHMISIYHGWSHMISYVITPFGWLTFHFSFLTLKIGRKWKRLKKHEKACLDTFSNVSYVCITILDLKDLVSRIYYNIL